MAYGLHGVDMHGGSLPGGGRHNVTDGLDGASFVLAHMQLTNAAGVSNVSPTPTIPEGETGSQLTSAPAPAASPRTVSNAAGCSMDELTMRRESLARYSPWMAMLSASVPDAVKITSMGSQFSNEAMSSRACSRAARRGACCVLPTRVEQC